MVPKLEKTTYKETVARINESCPLSSRLSERVMSMLHTSEDNIAITLEKML